MDLEVGNPGWRGDKTVSAKQKNEKLAARMA